ncbi:MAG: transposase, partial [Bacteroidota bacterium]|nr:transposase [Bacteroidota bacterium]
NKGWEKDYTKLAPNYKTGEQGPLVTDAQAERLLFYVKNPNRLKVSEIIRFAKTDMERNNIPVDKSDDTFRRYIMKWAKDHQDQWVFFREGEKALNDKNTPYLKRDRDLVEVGDLLVIDGHTLNFEIINPATGRPKRMTLILVFDYKSDYPLGWEIMPSENTYAITSAVRHALIRLGFKGRVVNIDNGRANKSKWFLGKFEECGIQGMFYKVFESVMIAQPYHGQSKTIERFFGSFSELERTLPTYSGTSIAMKPPRMMRAEKFHKNIYTKMTEGMALDIYQANYLVALWFDEFVKRPHADGFYKGLTPQEVYNDSIAKVMSKPDLESRIISKEELNFMMLSERVTTLYRNGIRFRGTEYFSPELYPFEKGADKHQFRIKYDDIEPETILVYDDKTGKYICEAKAKEYVHPLAKYMGTEEDKLRLAEQLGEKNRLLSGTIKTAKEYFEEYQSGETGKTVKLIEMKQIQTSAARQLRNKKEGNTDEGIELDYSDAQVSTEIDEDDIDLAITN